MRNNKIHIRSLAGAWFLGLFLFIYAEKLLHTHVAADHINKVQAHISSPAGCALCDFQPGRDAELLTQAAVTVPVMQLSLKPIHLKAILHELSYSIYGDRGPPFLA